MQALVKLQDGCRPDLSVIIPALDEAASIGTLLLGLRNNLGAGVELIVVDGGSNDATVSLATPLCDQLIVTSRGRARQMHAGALQATGHRLWFVHADSSALEPAAAWMLDDVKSSRSTAPVWGFFPVTMDSNSLSHRVIGTAMNTRSRLTGIGTGDQCLFVTRQLYQQAGGFAALELMEDIDICSRLRRLQPPSLPPGHVRVQVSARRWQQRGTVRTVLLMWWIRLAWFCGVSDKRLVQWYYPGAQRLDIDRG